jgi:hypothetical protein
VDSRKFAVSGRGNKNSIKSSLKKNNFIVKVGFDSFYKRRFLKAL